MVWVLQSVKALLCSHFHASLAFSHLQGQLEHVSKAWEGEKFSAESSSIDYSPLVWAIHLENEPFGESHESFKVSGLDPQVPINSSTQKLQLIQNEFP